MVFKEDPFENVSCGFLPGLGMFSGAASYHLGSQFTL